MAANRPAVPVCTAPRPGYLGVVVETQQDFDYPFPVAVDTSEIGGPSAGLAMTLGIIDTLSSGHLTGGRTVAATGTITPTGAVGDVGGVAQKTVAVERAGATVFFVPPDELAAAKSKDVPSLHIYAVSSLDAGARRPPTPWRPGAAGTGPAWANTTSERSDVVVLIPCPTIARRSPPRG